jgi:hypothetical protein
VCLGAFRALFRYSAEYDDLVVHVVLVVDGERDSLTFRSMPLFDSAYSRAYEEYVAFMVYPNGGDVR